MPAKINRILIPLFILIILLPGNQDLSAGQAPSNTSYLPIISYNPTGWIGPWGGTVVTVAFDPTNPQIVYAGSYGSGVYRSQDGGISWTSASQGLTNLYVYSLAVDPIHPSTLYAGTYHSQVFKSENGGTTWRWSGTGMQADAVVYSISIDGFNPAIIYAATRGQSTNGGAPWNGVLYRSTNGGASWIVSLKNLGGSDVQDWVYSVLVNPHAHNEVLIASHEHGPYRSDDYGETWYQIDNGISDFSGRSIVVGLPAAYSLTYYYGVWHNDSVYKSTNRGSSWLLANVGIPAEMVYSITLDPQNGKNVFLSTFTSGILKSSDGGDTWGAAGLAHDDIYTLVLNPDTPNIALAGTSGNGLYRSETAGGPWSDTNGINNAYVTSVVISPTKTSTIFASTYGGGMSQSVNLGQWWARNNAGLADLHVHDLVMDPAHPGLLYALTNDGGLFKNDVNNGNGWMYAGVGLPLTGGAEFVYPADHPFATLEMQEAFAAQNIETPNLAIHPSLQKMVFAPSNPQIAYIATAGAGVYRSSNGGASWQAAGLNGSTITTLAVDLVDPNLVYAATTSAGSLKVSSNGGQSWTSISLPVTFYTLLASPTQAGTLYVGTNDGIYRYQAGTWTPLGLTGLNVTALQLVASMPDLLYAGSDTGAFYSLNAGLDWQSVDNNLTSQTITTITVDPVLPSLVYFGTKTHGIFLVAIRF